MKSSVINAQPVQYKLDFEPGLTETYPSLRDCVASCVYRKGLTKVAGMINEAPGNLSVQLSASDARHFSIDSFESFLEQTRDFTPIYYQIEKFLSDKSAGKDAATAEVMALFSQLAPAMKKAGLL